MAKMAIYGHLAIEPFVTKMGKWGIPEKSYENVAQQNQLDGCNAFLSDFIAEKRFFAIFPLILPLQSKKNTYMGREGRRAKTKTVLKPVKQWEQLGSMPNWKFRIF